METLTEFTLVVRDYWGIAMMALFIGILAWVMRPGSKKTYDAAARIPLADDEPAAKAAGQTRGR